MIFFFLFVCFFVCVCVSLSVFDSSSGGAQHQAITEVTPSCAHARACLCAHILYLHAHAVSSCNTLLFHLHDYNTLLFHLHDYNTLLFHLHDHAPAATAWAARWRRPRGKPFCCICAADKQASSIRAVLPSCFITLGTHLHATQPAGQVPAHAFCVQLTRARIHRQTVGTYVINSTHARVRIHLCVIATMQLRP